MIPYINRIQMKDTVRDIKNRLTDRKLPAIPYINSMRHEKTDRHTDRKQHTISFYK
jgi:hypothetical protein